MNTKMTFEESHVTARSAWGKGNITEMVKQESPRISPSTEATMKLAKIDRITFLKLQNLTRKKELIAIKRVLQNKKDCYHNKQPTQKMD